MRIVHVATLVTPDGAYGGPIRVAINQLKELQSRGHEVVLIAGYQGYETVPREIEGVSVRLFRAYNIFKPFGFAGLTAPALLQALFGLIRDADVVHVHLARDLVTLPAAFVTMLHKKRVVLQTHGMIDASQKTLASLIDWVLTRHIFKKSHAVFHLTQREKREILRLFPDSALKMIHLVNGVPLPSSQCRPVPAKKFEFLFLARLQQRKNPELFFEASTIRIANGSKSRYTLVGPDEGSGPGIQRAINALGHDHISWEGPVAMDASLSRMTEADVYVLPSINEPFPMSVLEALSLGLPVIITNSNGLAPAIERAGAGIVIQPDVSSLHEAMARLEKDVPLRNKMSEAARKLAKDEFSMAAVTDILEQIYGADSFVSDSIKP